MAEMDKDKPAASAGPADASGIGGEAAISAESMKAAAATAAEAVAGALDQSTIDDLLSQASFDDPAAASQPESEAELEEVLVGASGGGKGASIPKFDLPSLGSGQGVPGFGGGDISLSAMDMLKDVELNVKIELGRSRMLVEDVLKLAEGSVVELDKLAGDPVDVFVNDRLVARGEVLVLNDNFCVRVNEIVAGMREDAL